MTCERTCTVACSQGTRRPFIQIVSAFVKAIPIPSERCDVAAKRLEYRAEGETISRRPAPPPGALQDQGRPGQRSPATEPPQTEQHRDAAHLRCAAPRD